MSSEIRQEADEYRERYQKSYDGYVNANTVPCVGDLVMLSIPATKRSRITTSKTAGYASEGPYIVRELVGKKCVRLCDLLWGKEFPSAVDFSRIRMYRCRNEANVLQVLACLLSLCFLAPLSSRFSFMFRWRSFCLLRRNGSTLHMSGKLSASMTSNNNLLHFRMHLVVTDARSSFTSCTVKICVSSATLNQSMKPRRK